MSCVNVSNKHIVYLNQTSVLKRKLLITYVYLITCRTMFVLCRQESYIGCSHYHGGNYVKNES